MQSSKMKKILKENQDVFEALENYDRTGELGFQKKRIDLTLSVRTINKLKKLRKETGKPVSQIIEDLLIRLDEWRWI